MRQIAEDVLKERYYQPGENCWGDVALRVSDFIGNDGDATEAYYHAILNLELIPNSPALMNAGTEKGGSLSACYAVPVYDSIDSIFDAVKACALIHKEGGGTGISLSRLRGKGTEVKGTGHMASGPVSFMHVFNAATETIKQGGKRRGANLGSLDVHHPDIKEFIQCKSKEGELSNFNISVILDDAFMKNPDPEIWNLIVEGNWRNGEPGILFKEARERDNKRPDLGELSETNPCVSGETKILTKEYGYQPISDFVDEDVEIWNGFEWSVVTPKVTGLRQKLISISVHIWKDNTHREDDYLCGDWDYSTIHCTPYHKFILEDGSRIEASKLIPGMKLSKYIIPGESEISQVIVDKVVDYNVIAHRVYCFEEMKNHSALFNGIMTGQCGETALLPWESCNLASINLMSCYKDDQFNWDKFRSLVRLGVRFLNDMIDKNRYPLPQIEEATKKTRKIGLGVMGFADLLIALDMTYGCQGSIDFADMLFKEMREVAEHESKLIGGNNAAVLSIAPTGTISIFANVSSGIEPNFGYVYDRTTQASGEKVKYREIHPMFDEHLKREYDESEMSIIIDEMYSHGTIQGCAWANEDTKRLFVTAKDIEPIDHVKIQATIQQHVDQAISKTINCPESTTKEEIGELIKFAWESGCKGLTIYREGSRADVVLETNATKKTEEKTPQSYTVIQLPPERDSKTFDCKSACGDLRVTVAYHNDKPIEVFVNAGDTGGCKANIEAIGRLASTAMRSGMPYEKIVEQLHKVDCPACKKGNSDGKSCADIIGKHIKLASDRRDMQVEILERTSRLPSHKQMSSGGSSARCPDCGSILIHTDGCKSCTCGYTACK